MTTEATAAVELVPQDIADRIIRPADNADNERVFEAYRWLRQNAPLNIASVEGWDPFWLVSKHEDVMEVERNPQLFTSGGGDAPGTHYPQIESQAGEEMFRSLTGGSLRLFDALPFMDPPEHSMVKDVANDWFRPANLKKREDSIRQLAREAIDKYLQVGDNQLEFVSDFALHFPLHVIMSLLGVPETDEPFMMAMTQQYFGASDADLRPGDSGSGTGNADATEAAINGLMAIMSYFDAIIDDRRSSPRDDLATIIAQARQSDGELFPRSFAHGWYLAIATAGHDTTSSTIAGIVEALAMRPDVLAQVQADPALIPGLVNEGLRWVSPVKCFVRQAVEDTVLRGRQVSRGDRLLLLYPSANRDEDVFAEPDTFDITRRPNPHIAFGYGPHMCIGQHLAKLEIRVMLEELLPRIESLAMDGETSYVKTNFVGGLKKLPVRLSIR